MDDRTINLIFTEKILSLDIIYIVQLLCNEKTAVQICFNVERTLI